MMWLAAPIFAFCLFLKPLWGQEKTHSYSLRLAPASFQMLALSAPPANTFEPYFLKFVSRQHELTAAEKRIPSAYGRGIQFSVSKTLGELWNKFCDKKEGIKLIVTDGPLPQLINTQVAPRNGTSAQDERMQLFTFVVKMGFKF